MKGLIKKLISVCVAFDLLNSILGSSTQKRGETLMTQVNGFKTNGITEYSSNNEPADKTLFYSFNLYCDDFKLMKRDGEVLIKSSNPSDISGWVKHREKVNKQYSIEGRCLLLVKHCNKYCTYTDFERACLRGPISFLDRIWQDSIEDAKSSATLECAMYP